MTVQQIYTHKGVVYEIHTGTSTWWIQSQYMHVTPHYVLSDYNPVLALLRHYLMNNVNMPDEVVLATIDGKELVFRPGAIHQAWMFGRKDTLEWREIQPPAKKYFCLHIFGGQEYNKISIHHASVEKSLKYVQSECRDRFEWLPDWESAIISLKNPEISVGEEIYIGASEVLIIQAKDVT
jgi:hypothetical protein